VAVNVNTEVWAADIAANLFPNNSFLARAIDDSMWVSNKTVNRAQSGAVPNVVRNRSSVPATATKRTDTNASYDISEFTSDPTLVQDIEEAETSYDKRQSVLRDHNEEINRKIANFLATQWCPSLAPQIIATTGSVRTAGAPGATGTRKALTKTELLRVKALFDAQEIPQGGRCLLIDAAMYNDLFFDSQILSREFMDKPNLERGSIGFLFGFELYMRSSVGRMATGNTGAKDMDAANAATDNAFALAWHENFVTRALGSVKVFANEDDALSYGSIFSALARAGGNRYYATQRGLAAIAEVV
jgi:hypothetical protein